MPPLRQQGPSPVLLSDEEPTPRSRARADAAIARRLQEREDAVARRAAESAARSEFLQTACWLCRSPFPSGCEN